jgi:hydroxyacylglutathione hydrolase
MALQFEHLLTPGIAQLSYLIGDSSTGEAAVIDPRPDCDVYIDMAREAGVSITHIFETHIHADFLSGARELAARVKTAKIYCSVESQPEYGFEHESVRDGDTFEIGSAMLTARHTPGHTPEHLSFLVAEKKHEDTPWGVFTGDSLFVDSVGRPDLLGDEETEGLMKQLYKTMYEFYLGLDDDVIIYPGHGQGSACGPEIGDRLSSTIGYERTFNKYLQCKNAKEFDELVTSQAPPAPTHYPRLKKVNAKGPEVIGHLPRVPALPPQKFKARVEKGDAVLVDTRSMLAFGGDHIEGALNIGATKAELSVFAGWMLDPETPILLVLESDEDLEQVIRYFWRTGFTKFAGYLLGGMEQWISGGLDIQKLPQVSVHEVQNRRDGLQVLDVRGPDEWEEGHIPGAVHHFFGDLRESVPDLDRDQPIATYCTTGYRASLAASHLQANGFNDVRNIPGSWSAWQSAGYPVEDGE